MGPVFVAGETFHPPDVANTGGEVRGRHIGDIL